MAEFRPGDRVRHKCGEDALVEGIRTLRSREGSTWVVKHVSDDGAQLDIITLSLERSPTRKANGKRKYGVLPSDYALVERIGA